MSSISQAEPTHTFHPFPHLPTELRLKIWDHYQSLSPPQLINFNLCKSDLDYLRLKRKACHDYPHIFASLPKRIPSILHVCRESRSIGLEHYTLGFDISRILSLGRQDTDVETYTTCSHEVVMSEQRRGIYWDKSKDLVVLNSAEWVDEGTSAYVWGGKTGIRLPKMKMVCMNFDTLTSCGIGEHLEWEGIDLLLVVRPESMSRNVMDDESRWAWGNRATNAEGYVKFYLASRGLFSTGGSSVEVKFSFESVQEVMDFVTKQEV